ncbi:DUF3558 family protein [Gordonia shandongensis]|uniref:DUF3558 family protein n=1 Tax=Gordonia shandongensis TaxID=376351 RepID=UPI00146C9C79|nr:DUF3558 family protein [Gordonia shandongensis]
MAGPLLQGCNSEGSIPRAGNSAVVSQGSSRSLPKPRQTDAAGRKLPFETKFHRRWSRANSGTEYEPCTALDSGTLQSLGVDPVSAEDAAGTDGQTLRGCRWQFQANDAAIRWTLMQFVGNSPSLNEDKRLKSTSHDIWLPDVRMAGRTVGVHRTTNNRDCDTYVQSGDAAVNTMVRNHGRPAATPEEICERALAFTRATIEE